LASTPAVAATPPIPPAANSATTGSGPWRRSSSHPYSATAPRVTKAKPVLSYTNGAVTSFHQSFPGLPTTATSARLICDVRHSRQPTRPNRTRNIVAYGRESARMPGISPLRRRESEGAGGLRRRRFSATRPSRSIFGARLRRRLPQYGHSVMYGLTSDPQLLQITNRSGPPALTIRL